MNAILLNCSKLMTPSLLQHVTPGTFVKQRGLMEGVVRPIPLANATNWTISTRTCVVQINMFLLGGPSGRGPRVRAPSAPWLIRHCHHACRIPDITLPATMQMSLYGGSTFPRHTIKLTTYNNCRVASLFQV